MLTVLWDNDGVPVDTEGLYFQACRQVLGSVGIDLTLEQFKDISLRRGRSVFLLAAERGITADEVGQLRKERDRQYTQLLASRCPVIDGVEDVLRTLHGRVRMGVVTWSAGCMPKEVGCPLSGTPRSPVCRRHRRSPSRHGRGGRVGRRAERQPSPKRPVPPALQGCVQEGIGVWLCCVRPLAINPNGG